MRSARPPVVRPLAFPVNVNSDWEEDPHPSNHP